MRSVAGRIHLGALVLAVFAATFWLTDAAVNRQPPPPSGPPSRPAGQPASRVFVILIDSLRYETAIDPGLMPELCALAREGASARFGSGFTPVTASSIRDIFTGRINSAVLAWAINFARVGASVESLFYQMAQRGFTSAVYSRWFIFDQFGPSLTANHGIPTQSTRAEEDRHVAAGLEAFRQGAADFVLVHLDSTDKVGHQFGRIDGPEYREAFRHADAFIARARAQLPPGATLVVLGDHGHDTQGRHWVGMEVPTFAAYVGPAFRPGAILPQQTIQTHRWLLSQALGLPVDAGHYDGNVVPEALRSSGRDPGPLLAGAARLRARLEPVTWPVWIYLSLLVGLLFNLAAAGHTPLAVTGWRGLLPWAALAPLFPDGARSAETGLGLALGVAVAWAWGRPRWRSLAWLVVPSVLALGFHGWGRVLAVLRPFAERLAVGPIALAWLLVAVGGAVIVTDSTRRWLTWGLFGAVIFLGFPTNESFGFAAAFAPLTGCWLLWWLVAAIRAGRLSRADGRLDIGKCARVALAALGMVLLLQPFATPEIVNGTFLRWAPLIPAWSAETAGFVVPLALAANLLIFLPAGPGPATWILAGLLAGGVTTLQWGGWRLPTAAWLAGLGGLLAGWLAAARAGWPAARPLGLASLLVAYRYFIWPHSAHFMHGTALMMAALILAARLVRAHPEAGSARSDTLALGTLALLATGWATCRWSLRDLDWEFAIAWVGISALETHAWFFGPLIALKNALPLVALAWCLRTELAPVGGLPENKILLGVFAKFGAVLLVNTGLAAADLAGGHYYYAAQLSGMMGLLALGVLFLPAAWPRELPRDAAAA